MFKYLNKSFNLLNKTWQNFFYEELYEDLLKIDHILFELSKNKVILPAQDQIFAAFYNLELNDIKVVILGQDPYHGDNQANGLAFAVHSGVKAPPSLRNILIELTNEYCTNNKILDVNILNNWVEEGVLLLNNTLTVIKDMPNSLVNIGWHKITNKIIIKINEQLKNVVFMLWGSFANQKKCLIDKKNHLSLSASHPSPLSAYRGFFGCNHFKLANQYLVNNGKVPINWI